MCGVPIRRSATVRRQHASSSSRGLLSAEIIESISGRETLDGPLPTGPCTRSTGDPVTDEDLQLSLWMLYELHYRGFEDVDDHWEWSPGLLAARRELEIAFEDALRRRTDATVDAALAANGDVPTRLFDLTGHFEGPSVARFVQREATRDQFVEFMMHRSIYHLKESDPHSFTIPRIAGKPKAALVELQYDEYGAGRPERLHATMFADSLEGCGLDRAYGAYLERVPAHTLAVNNLMSLVGLHRRLRGAAMGHLGAVEATSSLPSRRYAGGIRRLGLPEKVAEYFDEHVEADAVHEQLALRDICGELVRQEPALERDVFFGAAACLHLDALAGGLMLNAWSAGSSTLRTAPAGIEAVA